MSDLATFTQQCMDGPNQRNKEKKKEKKNFLRHPGIKERSKMIYQP